VALDASKGEGAVSDGFEGRLGALFSASRVSCSQGSGSLICCEKVAG
jgi:hypothetical protein